MPEPRRAPALDGARAARPGLPEEADAAQKAETAWEPSLAIDAPFMRPVPHNLAAREDELSASRLHEMLNKFTAIVDKKRREDPQGVAARVTTKDMKTRVEPGYLRDRRLAAERAAREQQGEASGTQGVPGETALSFPAPGDDENSFAPLSAHLIVGPSPRSAPPRSNAAPRVHPAKRGYDPARSDYRPFSSAEVKASRGRRQRLDALRPPRSNRRAEELWSAEVIAHGYTQVPTLLLHGQAHLGLTPLQLTVLVHLESYWWEPHRWPYPTKATLAGRIGMSERQIQRAMEQLEKMNLIRREPRFIGNIQTGNTYVLDGLRAKLAELAPIIRQEKDDALAARLTREAG